MKKRLLLLPIFAFIFSSCAGNVIAPPDDDENPKPQPEEIVYSISINNKKYNFKQDIHGSYIIRGMGEMQKGNSVTFYHKDEVFYPILSSNNNLASNPNDKTYNVINSCYNATMKLNIIAEDYIEAHLSNLTQEHSYTFSYKDTTCSLNNVSDRKKTSDTWISQYSAKIDADINAGMVFYEDLKNIGLFSTLKAYNDQFNNAYIDNSGVSDIVYCFNKYDDAELYLNVYYDHFEVYISGKLDSTLVSMIGNFDSLEESEIRMQYDSETNVAYKTVNLDFIDSFIITLDINDVRMDSFGYPNLIENEYSTYFRKNSFDIGIECCQKGEYTVSINLDNGDITITGEIDSSADDSYNLFINKTRYHLSFTTSVDLTINKYISPRFDVVKDDSIKVIKNAEYFKFETGGLDNNIVQDPFTTKVAKTAKGVTFTLSIKKADGSGSAFLNGIEHIMSVSIDDTQLNSTRVFDLVLDSENSNSTFNVFKLETPINVKEYEFFFIEEDGYSKDVVLLDVSNNNLKKIKGSISNEYMVRNSASNVNVMVKVSKTDRHFEVFLEGYDSSLCKKGILIQVLDGDYSHSILLQENKSYVGENGVVEYTGYITIQEGVSFYFGDFKEKPFDSHVAPPTSFLYTATISYSYVVFTATQDIIDAYVVVRIDANDILTLISLG